VEHTGGGVSFDEFMFPYTFAVPAIENAYKDGTAIEITRPDISWHKRSPSLTLNIPNAIPPTLHVLACALLGLLVQASVFVINGLAVYYWQWPRSGNRVASYGYPTWALGTACVTIGVCLSAWTIKFSTWQFSFIPRSQEHIKRFEIFFFQKAMKDLRLPAYAIFCGEHDPYIRYAQRRWPPPKRDDGYEHTPKTNPEALGMALSTVAWVGVSLTLAGFVCQNVGTRELHWSAGVLQLGATIILSVFRSLLRRHVGNGPTEAIELHAGYEASHLASRLGNCTAWTMLSPSLLQVESETDLQPQPDSIHQLPPQSDILIPQDQKERSKSKTDDLAARTRLGKERDDRLASHIIQVYNTLRETEPEEDDLTQVSEGIWSSIGKILESLEIKEFSWMQDVAFEIRRPYNAQSKTKKVAQINLSYSSDSEQSSEAIRSILGLTEYHLINSSSYDGPYTFKNSTRVLGYSKSDNSSRVQMFRKLFTDIEARPYHPKSGNNLNRGESDTEDINGISNGDNSDYFHFSSLDVFGRPSSAALTKGDIEISVRLLEKPLGPLARDFLLSFLLQLFHDRKDDILKYLDKSSGNAGFELSRTNSFIQTLVEALTRTEDTDDESALAVIFAAAIANGYDKIPDKIEREAEASRKEDRKGEGEDSDPWRLDGDNQDDGQDQDDGKDNQKGEGDREWEDDKRGKEEVNTVERDIVSGHGSSSSIPSIRSAQDSSSSNAWYSLGSEDDDQIPGCSKKVRKPRPSIIEILDAFKTLLFQEKYDRRSMRELDFIDD
jgi:hypothetical protein